MAADGPPADAPARLLETLERLLAIPTGNLRVALSSAADLVAEALRADKVDTFLYDPARDSLVAHGTSNQPLSALERKHGLDVLPLSNGGRVVHVYRTGETFIGGRLEDDGEELRGVKEALAIRSKLGVPLDVGEARRGVLMIASQQPDFFTAADARFAESVGRWVASVAHRAELMQEIARAAAAQGRRAAAEELITVLAHDLRNYLEPIGLRLAVVRRRANDQGRPDDVREIGLAQKGMARLHGIISDLLDVARIDEGVLRLDLGPVDAVALAHDLARTLATPAQPVEVKASEQVVVHADPARLRQCLENIVANAVKHSPPNVPVVLLIGYARDQRGEWGQIEIVDQGPGVSVDLLPHIFDRFVTGPRRQGLGLGLYLAKGIALLHGGDLTVDSTPGMGARFVLTLPVAEER